ncbi:DNA protection during starvation protein [Porphyromonas levii]|nr:DNA protection during starvation protein [Porphyromonas levii]MBR8729734.1 DNA protection during starvation protein [Porphyromonas levii]MBR8759959.1 DNA protection during starvation protein [Porphyromonas levii]MBR8764505.1 DNA protection during starvation protein [Porphyromonas levii]MBR8785176.1 DNA protection during starvation protein [Porphyromonas levii]
MYCIQDSMERSQKSSNNEITTTTKKREVMKVINITGLKKENAEKMVKALNNYLANLHVYYSNLRGYHWHVEGIHFFGMHSKLEELYNEAFSQIDEVAERILMLDGTPVRMFSDITALATLKEVGVTTDATAIVKDVLATIKSLIAQERELLALADELDDTTTDDLITGFLTGHEKQAWMFTALMK